MNPHRIQLSWSDGNTGMCQVLECRLLRDPVEGQGSAVGIDLCIQSAVGSLGIRAATPGIPR
jgi:hypothetical protein